MISLLQVEGQADIDKDTMPLLVCEHGCILCVTEGSDRCCWCAHEHLHIASSS
jgi:hypothetical protein